jgi:hypothetical protein
MTNPWNDKFAVDINVSAVWNWFKKKMSNLRDSLKKSRERYRKALHFKEPAITEQELYDERDTDNKA